MKTGSKLLLALLPFGLAGCVTNHGYGYAPAPYASTTYYGGGYYAAPYPRAYYGYGGYGGYGYSIVQPAPAVYPAYPMVRSGPSIGIRYDFDGGRRGWGGHGWGHGGWGFRHR